MSGWSWIGVDLDGTLAHYDKWRGETHIGAPVPAMMARVKRWLEQGLTVKIVTARVSGRDGAEIYGVRRALEVWCREHVGQDLEVVCCKDYQMVELWDDRAIQVEKNTGRRMDGTEPVVIPTTSGPEPGICDICHEEKPDVISHAPDWVGACSVCVPQAKS